MGGFERGIIYLNLGAALALLIRLSLYRLVFIYRWLTVYILGYALQFVIVAAVPLRTTLYGYFYMLGESLGLLLSILVVLELVRLSLAEHRALAVFGRRAVFLMMVLAALLAASGLVLDPVILPGQSPFMHRFFTAERTLDFTVLIVLLAISIFMLWFPVRLRRNIVLYIGGFAVFYLSRTFGLLAINLLPPASLRVISDVLMLCSAGCLIMWFWGLRREDQDSMTVVGHRWNPAEMQRLYGQLDEINATLERFRRP